MPDRPEVQRRKALRRAAQARQRAHEDAGVTVARETLWALFDSLDESIAEGCDHSLRLTARFLASRGIAVESVVPWLGEYGGFCDCEVLANVESRWGRH